MDISSSEWKKDTCSPCLGESQQIKNCRTKSAILHELTKVPMDTDEKESLYVMAMDWIGKLVYIHVINMISTKLA
jgi:hypothetical protein